MIEQIQICKPYEIIRHNEHLFFSLFLIFLSIAKDVRFLTIRTIHMQKRQKRQNKKSRWSLAWSHLARAEIHSSSLSQSLCCCCVAFVFFTSYNLQVLLTLSVLSLQKIYSSFKSYFLHNQQNIQKKPPWLSSIINEFIIDIMLKCT